MKFKLDKTYQFDLTGQVKFGDIPPDKLYDIFKDGRCASFLLEPQLTYWFESLKHITGCKDHDHVDDKGVKYDAKNFTISGGLKFMSSSMLGTGRVFQMEIAHEKANELIYICCDIVEFPKVNVIFKKGKELIKEYPNCRIPKSDREFLFG